MTPEELQFALEEFDPECDNLAELASNAVAHRIGSQILRHVRKCRNACPGCEIWLCSAYDDRQSFVMTVGSSFRCAHKLVEFFTQFRSQKPRSRIRTTDQETYEGYVGDVEYEYIFKELRRRYEESKHIEEEAN